MAYTYYHPAGDDSNEVQLYIFEMADPLKALGKYGSEKPDEVEPLDVGYGRLHLGGQPVLLRGPVLHPDRLDHRRPQVRRVRRWRWPGGSPPSRSRAAGRPDPGLGIGRCRGWPTARTRPRPGARRPPTAAATPRGPLRPAPRGAGKRSRSTSPRTSSATASSPTSSWPITRRATSPGKGSSGPTATPKEARERLREVPRGGQAGRRRSQGSWRPKGPTGWSSAPTSACSTSSSCKGNAVGGANGATDAEARRSLRPGVRQGPPRRSPAFDGSN